MKNLIEHSEKAFTKNLKFNVSNSWKCYNLIMFISCVNIWLCVGLNMKLKRLRVPHFAFKIAKLSFETILTITKWQTSCLEYEICHCLNFSSLNLAWNVCLKGFQIVHICLGYTLREYSVLLTHTHSHSGKEREEERGNILVRCCISNQQFSIYFIFKHLP